MTSTPEAIRSVADDYLATLRAFGPDAKRVTDKALGNFMLLGIINRVFPNATLIHCRRHPIDNALSIFTTNFETNFLRFEPRRHRVFLSGVSAADGPLAGGAAPGQARRGGL